MTSNSAAWLKAEKTEPFEVDVAPFPSPGENQLVLRNHAVAINPIDGVLQKLAIFPLKYPTILGHDVAGMVEYVGPKVTRFKKGDRLLGHAAGFSAIRMRRRGFKSLRFCKRILPVKFRIRFRSNVRQSSPLAARPRRVQCSKKTS
jgi:threonine dehydrogenase-like Zn-dependent dehydrogenase